DDDLRGLAHVQYVPQVGQYLAYLTVHGNPADVLKPLRLEVWDASACQRYGSVVESFTFQPDNVIGILTNPQLVHTGGLLLREVPIGSGWNWLSFNLAFPDNSLGAALASLDHPQNDLIKGQAAFSQYSGGWFGTLTTLNNTTMYIYRADLTDTLLMQGLPIDPLTTNIPLVSGWNWIGYLPNYTLAVNDALSSLPVQNGDIIKSQYAFAQYLNPTYGWVGSLKYMSPPNGYQIRLTLPGILTYPPAPSPLRGGAVQERGDSETPPPAALWTVNPAQYEHSSTLIGMLRADGVNATTSDMELGAFAGAEVRGSAQAVYIEPIDAHLFFLTTYANTNGELIRFKLYDDGTGTVRDLAETMYFSPNQHQGAIEAPVPFEAQTTGTGEDLSAALSFDVSPNPFSSETTLRFVLPAAREVTLTISDAQGREVVRRPVSATAGMNTLVWNGRSDTGSWLGSGVYMVRLLTEQGSASKRVVVQRVP
ncbi:MAG: T9SS type A sorting domain-containing protein, partial [Thermoanaerobaculia bacterium]|nr:T9SS type A sorting domain-containing protein [Thermoanaerobaculia bacterium]